MFPARVRSQQQQSPHLSPPKATSTISLAAITQYPTALTFQPSATKMVDYTRYLTSPAKEVYYGPSQYTAPPSSLSPPHGDNIDRLRCRMDQIEERLQYAQPLGSPRNFGGVSSMRDEDRLGRSPPSNSFHLLTEEELRLKELNKQVELRRKLLLEQEDQEHDLADYLQQRRKKKEGKKIQLIELNDEEEVKRSEIEIDEANGLKELISYRDILIQLLIKEEEMEKVKMGDAHQRLLELAAQRLKGEKHRLRREENINEDIEQTALIGREHQMQSFHNTDPHHHHHQSPTHYYPNSSYPQMPPPDIEPLDPRMFNPNPYNAPPASSPYQQRTAASWQHPEYQYLSNTPNAYLQQKRGPSALLTPAEVAQFKAVSSRHFETAPSTGDAINESVEYLAQQVAESQIRNQFSLPLPTSSSPAVKQGTDGSFYRPGSSSPHRSRLQYPGGQGLRSPYTHSTTAPYQLQRSPHHQDWNTSSRHSTNRRLPDSFQQSLVGSKAVRFAMTPEQEHNARETENQIQMVMASQQKQRYKQQLLQDALSPQQ